MSEKAPSTAYRERVYEAFADRGRSFPEAVETALQAGSERLGADIGFLTCIEGGTQYIEQAVGDHAGIQPGAECPLEEAYCRSTLEQEGLLSVQDAQASSKISTTAYEAFGLGSYIGSKVVVDGAVYGTVCFASHEARETPFSEAEALFVERVAGLVGRAIERRQYERRRDERTAELAAEKRRFESLARNSTDVIFRVDVDGELTYVSDVVEAVLGYEPAELVGAPFAALIDETEVQGAFDAFQRLLDGESVQQLEYTFLHRDGHTVPMEINATAVRDGDTVTAVQGTARDITDRKRRESEIRLRTRAMEEAEVPITMADATAPDNHIIYANAAFERVTGYGEDAIVGQNCRILQGPRTDPDAVARLQAGIDANRPVTVQLLNYRRDGTPFWNRVTVTPIADETGAVTHYLGFQQDVTEQQRTTRLVELLNRVLRHNLRNELTVIDGYTDFIDDPPQDVDVAERIRRPVSRLASLSGSARDLEALAQAEKTPKRLDSTTLLESVADRHRNDSATIDCRVETDRGICAGRELDTALDELLTNAVAHDPDDHTAISLHAHDDGEWVVVTVTDDGPGIPPTEVAVVEAGEETPLKHGKGLGLWLVNWVATHYGGSFQLTGGDGTTATLRLPAISEDQPIEDASRRPTALLG